MTDIMFEYPAKAAGQKKPYKLTIDKDIVLTKTEIKFKNIREAS